jgi:hypothetical protein
LEDWKYGEETIGQRYLVSLLILELMVLLVLVVFLVVDRFQEVVETNPE